MLYLAIPAHNEAATIGVLLWRLRSVLAEFPREYEAVVYDDASSDSTSEILESYARVMPLTVLRGEKRVGYAGAVDALIRHVVRDTRYPRRDAMLLLQGDFTDSPTLVPEFVRRFEGGTDVVVGERGSSVRRKAPTPVRRLMRVEPWLLRFLVRADGIRDLTSSYRLIRLSVLRDLLRAVGENPALAGDSRTANADLIMRVVPLARRVETLPVEPTWDVRLRETRVVAMADGMNLFRWAWKSRGLRAVPSSAPEPSSDITPRHQRSGRGDKETRPGLRLESRGESGNDRDSSSADGARHGSNRESGRGGRKQRAGRGDNRNDGRAREEGLRNEKRRDDNRPEGRPAKAGDQRHVDNRGGEARRADKLVTESDAAGVPAGDDAPLRDKSSRRKRSRRGGRDRDSVRANSGETGEAGALPLAAGADGTPEQALPIRTSGPDSSVNQDVELSPALSGAIEDAEAELDGEGRERPRRKRRRRGSRNRRDGARAEGGSDLADGAATDVEASEAGSLSSPESESVDSERPARHRRARQRQRDAGEDLADGSAESADEAPGGDEQVSAGGVGRTRRRGRRGRRGGARKNRAIRGEAGTEGGFADSDAPPISGREPGDAE